MNHEIGYLSLSSFIIENNDDSYKQIKKTSKPEFGNLLFIIEPINLTKNKI